MNSQIKKTISLLIITILFMVPVTQALSMPLEQDLIISFSDGEEEESAIITLSEHNPDSKVVNYDSPLIMFDIFRHYGDVFVVGHGNEEGLKTNNGIVSYEKINAKLARSPGKTIGYIACNSADAASKLSQERAYGFENEVEPVFGALVASFITGSKTVTFGLLLSRVTEIGENPEDYSALAIVGGIGGDPRDSTPCTPGLYGAEVKGHYTAIFFIIMAALLTAVAAISAVALETVIMKFYMAIMFGLGVDNIKIILEDLWIGIETGNFDIILGRLGHILELVQYIFATIGLYVMGAIAVAMSIAVVTDAAIMTLATAVKIGIILALVVTMAWQISELKKDKADCDAIYLYHT
ncbi:MAG: hypothetical protein INQ03_12515 [Candidatus Heimdallarchaeota archaeon]|nr:hypothetical protein [Candidatus Heimdallarchaeota archaeon]